MEERLKKWRMILGKDADPEGEYELEGEAQGMDDVLEALYDSERKAGLGSSAPSVNRWLGDIRKYFPTPIVQLMQKDALERLGLKQMLLEPELLESVEPDINLVTTILSLNKVMPEKTKATARLLVRKVVEELEKKLRNPLRQAIEGSIHRAVRNRRPRYTEIDWHKTIRVNLKHYQEDLNTIIPEQLIGHGRKGQALKTVILLVDQSGSMATSVVYASVFGAIMASVRSVKTHMVVFDTSVVDLSEELEDPVSLLFGTQLGGGTDINRALTYAEGLVRNPSDTILLLITDLFEGGSEEHLLRRAAAINSSGVQLVTLLALSDQGAPAYDQHMATQFAGMGIPTFACTPDLFPPLMAAAIKKQDLSQWAAQQGIARRG
ncbi:MAG: VWA domain-containing protein [Bacteroidota bacterium]